MTDLGPLPAQVSEYAGEHRDATPDEILRECNLDEARRSQVEHYLAVTRYTLYHDDESIDADGLRWDRVEWSDVAKWDVLSFA